MTQPANTDQLLLVSASHDQEHLATLAEQLARISTLDGYTLRQRLVGTGLAQLAKGSLAALQPLAAVLRQHQIPNWIVPPPQPHFTPQLINGVDITPEHIVFHTEGAKQLRSTASITLEHGSKLLVIVADLSGQVAENQVKRLLVHTTYSGNAPASLSTAELRKEIFKYAPVVDIYWRGEDGAAAQGARIFPGCFDHRQLGDKASLSRNGNLLSLLERIEEYAKQPQLDYNFGLGFLPACQVQPSLDPSVQQENLVALTAYAQLLLDIGKNSRGASTPNANHNNQPAELINNIGLEQIGAPIFGAASSQEAPDASAATPSPSTATPLPPPPAGETRSGFRLYFSLWRALAAGGGIFIILISQRHESLATFIYKYGITTGLIPALLCIWALGAAIHFWRLKQRIENTPTSKARSAAMGMIEVHGRAKRLYALVSPISQLPCVYYCLKKYTRRNRDHQWRLNCVTSSGNIPFILEDDSGAIRIDPHGATLSPQSKTEGVPGQSNILFTSNRAASPYEKWQEEVLHAGCALYVMGFARDIRGLADGVDTIKHQVGKKLRELKNDREQLMRYDRDGDGHIDAGEWDQARSAMEQQSLREKLITGQHRNNQQLTIGQPPQKGLPFIIAETETETKLTSRYSWYVLLLLSAALAALIWAMTNANHYFNVNVTTSL